MQRLPKYIYLSPPLIFPTLTTELGQKTAQCESLRALLPYVEWDRFVTLAGSKSGLRVTLSYLRQLGLPTLEYQRDRNDMIQVYKTIHGLMILIG